MADAWPDHPAEAVAGADQWPDHPGVGQTFYPDTELRAAPLFQNPTGGDVGAPSMAPGILAGAASLPVGAAQLAAHGAAAVAPETGGALAKAMDAANRWLANPGQQDPGLYDAGRTIGTYAAPVALAPLLPAAPASALGRIAYGAATGAGLGAATPIDNPDQDFWKQKAAQTGTGMAIGGAIPTAGAAGRALMPGPSPAIQTMRAAGVEPTPGAAAGGLPAIAEDLWAASPFSARRYRLGGVRRKNNSLERLPRTWRILTALGSITHSLQSDRA